MSIDAPIRITLEQDGDYAFRIAFEGTELEPLLSDEPSPLGADRGPNPARLLLASVGNCLVASLLFALRKQRNTPAPLRAEVNALPVRNEHGRWRIASAQVTLHLPGHNADYKALDRVFAQFEDFCVVTQSVRQGIDVDVSVVDGEGRVLYGDKSFEAGS
ncbi:MAG TPA: OsmC family protein [Luteimonas sp.]|nr:OsmC family protein [Luteimonas sp.]HRO26579.1 OsmC family protein [Luteimonas sp.]HRP71811.1 OsmC family protein [Luteimonas sp.]